MVIRPETEADRLMAELCTRRFLQRVVTITAERCDKRG